MVLQKYGDRLYAGLVQTMSAHLQGLAGGIEAAQGPLFLPELNNRWKDYLKSLQVLRSHAVQETTVLVWALAVRRRPLR